jgi:hypothetical protein
MGTNLPEVTVTVREASTGWRARCDFCGVQTEKHTMSANCDCSDGQRLEMCEMCVRAGPDGVKRRMLAYAERLLDHAAHLQDAAPNWRFVLPSWGELYQRCFGKSPEASGGDEYLLAVYGDRALS